MTADRIEAARKRLAAWRAAQPFADVAHQTDGRLRRARLMLADSGSTVELAHLNRDRPELAACLLEAADDLATLLEELDRARAELAEALEDRDRCEAENVELQRRVSVVYGEITGVAARVRAKVPAAVLLEVGRVTRVDGARPLYAVCDTNDQRRPRLGEPSDDALAAWRSALAAVEAT